MSKLNFAIQSRKKIFKNVNKKITKRYTVKEKNINFIYIFYKYKAFS
jgi:hypothetical protein